MSPSNIIKQKFRGALIGALVGDCYGAPFECRLSADPSSLLDDLDRLSRGDKVLSYTDDTAMSISTCKSLIKNKGFDAKHMARQFSESYFEQPRRGYGPAVGRVFQALREDNYRDPFKPAKQQFEGRGSFGNGAAMRCVGIGLFAFSEKLDDEATIALSNECARITHTHVHALNGASLLVLAVKYCLQHDDSQLDELLFLDHLTRLAQQLEPGQEKIYTDKLKLIGKVLEQTNISGADVSQTEIVRMLGHDVAAQNSVPLAIYSFLRGISKFNDSYRIENEFLRTLHWAVSCGGDTDTIASMACGLCGSLVGLERIPENLYKNCESWTDVLCLAEQMYWRDNDEMDTSCGTKRLQCNSL